MVVGANDIYKIKLLWLNTTLQQPLAYLSLEYHKCASAECNTMQQKIKANKDNKKIDPSDHSLSLSLAVTSRPAARCRMQTHAGFGKWQVATCAPHGADDRMQGVLIGNGGEEGGHKQKPRK
jgi:hypothetical protein